MNYIRQKLFTISN